MLQQWTTDSVNDYYYLNFGKPVTYLYYRLLHRLLLVILPLCNQLVLWINKPIGYLLVKQNT